MSMRWVGVWPATVLLGTTAQPCAEQDILIEQTREAMEVVNLDSAIGCLVRSSDLFQTCSHDKWSCGIRGWFMFGGVVHWLHPRPAAEAY